MTTFNAASVGVRGRFRIQAHRVDSEGNEIRGSRRDLVGWQNNLITDAGLDMLATTTTPHKARWCRVGSGSAAPAPTDTSLVSQIASVQGDNGSGSSGVGYSAATFTYTFSQGAVQGNLAEIGFSQSESGPLFSRALIKDGNGNPTTITVTEIDVLTVTYEVRLYISQEDVVSSVVVGGVTHTTTTRGAGAGYASSAVRLMSGINNFGYSAQAYTGELIPVDNGGAPSGPIANAAMTKTWSSYIPGTHYMDIEWAFGTAQGNSPTVRTIGEFATSGNYNAIRMQTQFEPPLSKNNTQTLKIKWRIRWGRMP